MEQTKDRIAELTNREKKGLKPKPLTGQGAKAILSALCRQQLRSLTLCQALARHNVSALRGQTLYGQINGMSTMKPMVATLEAQYARGNGNYFADRHQRDTTPSHDWTTGIPVQCNAAVRVNLPL